MNWPEIFLGCFVVGFVLSVMSFAFGIIDMHVHFPWETHVHVGHVDAGHMSSQPLARPWAPTSISTPWTGWIGRIARLTPDSSRLGSSQEGELLNVELVPSTGIRQNHDPPFTIHHSP